MTKFGSRAITAALAVTLGSGFIMPTPPTELPPMDSFLRRYDLTFVPPKVDGFREQAVHDTIANLDCISVSVSSKVSPYEEVGISYTHWPAEKQSIDNRALPVILVHDFDSSCLEYRRIGSKLAENGIDTHAVDVLGWGFSQKRGVNDFSAESKIEALNSFIEKRLGPNQKFCIAGSNLGGAAALELAALNTKNCEGVVLIDANGIEVGASERASLRRMNGLFSQLNKIQISVDDKAQISKLHRSQDGWLDAKQAFLESGGFPTFNSEIQTQTLLIGGKNSEGVGDALKLMERLPNSEFRCIDGCDNMPHLEKPEETAFAISDFIHSKLVDEEKPVVERRKMPNLFFLSA